jgi:two-component system cell cycle sensor histidine kinase/response regulator CckA
LANFISPQDQDIYHFNLVKILSKKDHSFSVHLNTAEPLWVRIDTLIEVNNDERTIEIRGTVTDISELKRLEHQRQELERNMFLSRKLESLGLLAAGISHDFNNFITIISGHLSLLNNKLSNNHKLGNHIEAIETATERAADLCKLMLTYSDKGSTNLEAINLNLVIKEMMSLIEATITNRTTIRLDLGADLHNILAPRTQITRVIMNLVINASEAIQSSANPLLGEIVITTACIKHREPEQNQICLEVTDNGCGMDETVKEKIFDPFFSTKFSGRGLGMSSILGILQSANAEIVVRSKLKEGTCIRIFFKQPNAAKKEIATPQIKPKVSHSGKILVVDDEPAIRALFFEGLTRAGFDVTLAEDGRQAILAF